MPFAFPSVLKDSLRIASLLDARDFLILTCNLAKRLSSCSLDFCCFWGSQGADSALLASVRGGKWQVEVRSRAGEWQVDLTALESPQASSDRCGGTEFARYRVLVWWILVSNLLLAWSDCLICLVPLQQARRDSDQHISAGGRFAAVAAQCGAAPTQPLAPARRC